MYPDDRWIESTKFIFNLDNKSIQKSKMDLFNNNKFGFESWIKDSIAEVLKKEEKFYEINIQGAESDDERDSIAKLTQKLRNMNITYNKESSAPLPLYCISRIGEYIKAELDEK